MAGSMVYLGDNKYRLFISDGFGTDKKRRRLTRTIEATSQLQADKALARFSAEVQSGSYVDNTKMTIAEFGEYWLIEHVQEHLTPKTQHEYKQLMQRVNKDLGHIRLGKLRPTDLLSWYNSLQKEGARLDGKRGGLSSSTIAHYHGMMSSMFKKAVQWQIMADNPAERVEPPKLDTLPTAHFTADTVDALLLAVESEPLKYKVMINLAIVSGMRRGEFVGLKWQDIDFRRNMVTIGHVWQYVPGKGCFEKPPKTVTSARTMNLPEIMVRMLSQLKEHQSELREKQGGLWRESGHVFTNDFGAPMHPDTPTKWFRKFCIRHELPHVPLHGLRHSSVTILLSQGIDAKNVSARLGHSTTVTTDRIYSHPTSSVDKKAADIMGQLQQKVRENDKKTNN